MFVGDLHLTDRSQDEYRFRIFDWIRRQQEKNPVAATFLAGDITDSKDRHSATLVNKIVAGLLKLKPPIYIDMGNHDYRDNKNPFFKFLSHIEGITFVTEPTVIKAIQPIAIIPHYREQNEFTAAVNVCGSSSPISYLVHQTFDGAIAESGVRLSGLSASPIELLKPPLGVYAGDVHRPQTQGLVTYIGCPYQVRFGDDFEPRCIHVSKSGVESYPWFDAPRKWALTVRGPENLLSNKHLMEGDQIKLTIEMAREEAVEWKKVRQQVLDACKELKLDVYGVKLEVKTNAKRDRSNITVDRSSSTVSSILQDFCKHERVSKKIRETGEGIVNGNKNLL